MVHSSRSRKLKWIAFISVDVLLAIMLVGLFILRSERTEISELRDLGATVFPDARPIQAFDLVDQSGQAFTESALSGQWSLVFFGFTHCPDVCPLTMRELALFYEQLQEANAQVLPQVIMATVDPERDSPARLHEYLAQYHDDFVGLTGSNQELAQLAAQLYVVATGATAEDEHENHNEAAANMAMTSDFNHSGHISVINPRGELHAVIRLPHRQENLMAAYPQIIND